MKGAKQPKDKLVEAPWLSGNSMRKTFFGLLLVAVSLLVPIAFLLIPRPAQSRVQRSLLVGVSVSGRTDKIPLKATFSASESGSLPPAGPLEDFDLGDESESRTRRGGQREREEDKGTADEQNRVAQGLPVGEIGDSGGLTELQVASVTMLDPAVNNKREGIEAQGRGDLQVNGSEQGLEPMADSSGTEKDFGRERLRLGKLGYGGHSLSADDRSGSESYKKRMKILSSDIKLRIGEGEGSVEGVRKGESVLEEATWVYEKLATNCTRGQGCALLVEAVRQYRWRPGGADVYYRRAPWRPHVARWLRTAGDQVANISVWEPLGDKACPNACHGRGVCNSQLGICHCQSGWKGDGCEEDDLYPCNYPAEEDWPLGPWVVSICAATCNQRRSTCECGADTKHPGRPAGSAVGFPGETWEWDFQHPDPALVASNNTLTPGWCNTDIDNLMAGEAQLAWGNPGEPCSDGWDGVLCEVPLQQFCFNQCSENGLCDHGFCQCHRGWYGLDCSIPNASTDLSNAQRRTPPWLLSSQPTTVKQQDANGVAAVNKGRKNGSLVKVERRRPLIYIYDLPPEFHTHHLQRRHLRFLCTPRMYWPSNITMWVESELYGSEIVIFEAMLNSNHRTMNADEADFFLVPSLGSCQVARFGDSPRFNLPDDYRCQSHDCRMAMSSLYSKQAYQYIRSHYPYWDRHGGRDHIWTHVWDEGACAAPIEIWNSTLLVHWGNTAVQPRSTTAYGLDSWQGISESIRGDHPCYDPAKDIVIPSFKVLNLPALEEQLFRRPYEERNMLFYFNGNLGKDYEPGRPEDKYSWGIRQTVAKYFASTPNREGKLGLRFDREVNVTHRRTGSYADALSSSKFCGVFPGDGWSGRLEDSILHGCIPVIIQDGIHLPFENFLDYPSFAVRIPEKDIPSMVRILRRIPEDVVRAKLWAVQDITSRFAYSSAFLTEHDRQRQRGLLDNWGSLRNVLPGDDAVDTILQILHYKSQNDKSRQASRRGKERDVA